MVTGSESFSYTVSDGMGGYATATIADGPIVWLVTLYAYGMSAEQEDYGVGGTAWFADGSTIYFTMISTESLNTSFYVFAEDDADGDNETPTIEVLAPDSGSKLSMTAGPRVA